MAVGSSETSEYMYPSTRRHSFLHNRCAMRTSYFRSLNWKYQLRLLNSFRGRPVSMIALWVYVCVCVHVASTCTCAVPHEAHDSHELNPMVKPWGVHVQTTSATVEGAGRWGGEGRFSRKGPVTITSVADDLLPMDEERALCYNSAVHSGGKVTNPIWYWFVLGNNLMS